VLIECNAKALFADFFCVKCCGVVIFAEKPEPLLLTD